MRVKCVASLSPLIWRKEDRESSAVQSLPIRDMREALLLGKHNRTQPIHLTFVPLGNSYPSSHSFETVKNVLPRTT